jgi:urea transporter
MGLSAALTSVHFHPFLDLSGFVISLTSIAMLIDLKLHTMMQRNKVTIVKSLAVDKKTNEFVLTTVQNYKGFEAVHRFPVKELELDGEVREVAKAAKEFSGEDCKLRFYRK